MIEGDFVYYEDTCELCHHDEYCCTEVHPKKGFKCTRPQGHEGQCAACGTGDEGHPLELWWGEEDEQED